tara:strand:+ start:7369 stop:7605 length:237 start_codon:yes stop_codon:yes gene_type:complete
MIQIYLVAFLGAHTTFASCDAALAQAQATLPADLPVSCMLSFPEPEASGAPLRPRLRPENLCAAPCTALRPQARTTNS